MQTKMKFKLATILAAQLICLTSIAPCMAIVQGYNVDATVGLDSITGGGTSNSSVGYGVRAGYHLDPHLEAGIGFSRASNSNTVGTTSTSSTLGLILADLNYHFSNEFNPLYVGVRLGMGLRSNSSTFNGVDQGSQSNANFAYGLVGGYDFVTGRNFTIGPKVAYTIVTPSKGVSQSDFQAHVAFKYFF